MLVSVISGPNLGHCEAIEFEGGIWIVTRWLESPHEGYKTPGKMLLLASVEHQVGGYRGAAYGVTEPLPTQLFDESDLSSLEARFVVRLAPVPVRIEIPRGFH